MRLVVISCLVSLSLSIGACAGSADEADAPVSPAASQAEGAPGALDDPAAPGAPAAPSGSDASDAGAPSSADAASADAGGDAGKKQIPLPTMGALHATTSTGEPCAFSVDGVAKGTTAKLDVALYAGSHAVSCARADGAVANANVTVVSNQTTNVVMALPAPSPATIIAVAVGGTCAFTVNGAAKGTTSTLTITVAPGTYTVGCTANGALKTRDVTVASGETSMAMFKLN